MPAYLVVASAPITLTILPLTVKARFEPSSVSGRAGETKRVTLVMTVDPPFPQGAVPTYVLFPPYNHHDNELSRIVNTGPTQGDGAVMRTEIDFEFFDTLELPDHRTSGLYNLFVFAGDLTGYRVNNYKTSAALDMSLIR
ncbi:hypothetical protein GCM10008955_23920 [Deinococcus malanensis]|uniref:DUF4426 domain-containing protein n=1 Tax=Deinococcus malanensis TaxID=1706855 RepID=A0ABQ2F045_9DEIO|nr:hypothetical protein [Deinococcus malanensis]GGK29359.1 hypothetical protein GCM10008955_23920 [Deinococcus malanensis]